MLIIIGAVVIIMFLAIAFWASIEEEKNAKNKK